MAEPVHDAALLALLAAGEIRSEGLAAGLGVPARTVQYRLARLRNRGLVASPTRGAWRLTGAGQRAALTATVPEPTASIAVLDTLPAEHRALLRLVEDAVVARRALGNVYLTNWPAFLLLGPTKSGKTFLASLAVRRFGIDPAAAVRLLMLETTGSLFARRVQTGADTWTSAPSPLLSLPLVTLDEFDKAGPDLRQAAFAYLAGASRYQNEGVELDVYATVIVTLNAECDPGHLLSDAYLRRSVVLDTTPLRAVTRDLDEVAATLARVVLPQVSPDLAPPAPSLPDNARRGLRLLLRNCLTERGWELVDVEAVSRLVLGRWATLPADLAAAVLAVAADYMLVTATRKGLVEPDWPARLEAVVGRPAAPIAETLAVARERQAAVVERTSTLARAELDATLALAGTRERLRDSLDHALRSAPRGHELTPADRATIATARGKARPLRDAVAGARSLDALHELERRLEQEVLLPLAAVAADIDARRGAAAQQRRSELDLRRRAADLRVAERAQARRAQQAAKRRYADLQALYRRTATRPGENVLAALLAANCLVLRSEEYQEETLASMVERSRVGRKLRTLFDTGPKAARPAPAPPWNPGQPWAPPPPPVTPEPEPRYVTRTRAWYEDGAGCRRDPGELIAWGNQSVCAVLEAAAAAEELPRLTHPATRRTAPRPISG